MAAAENKAGIQHIVLASQAMTNSATATANFDTLGPNGEGQAGHATVTINLQTEINTNAIGPTISLLESDDTVVTNFATVVADRTAEVIVAAKLVVYHIDLRGRKRFLRLSVTTETTTNDNITVSALGVLTAPKIAPASTGDMVSSTSDAVVIV